MKAKLFLLLTANICAAMIVIYFLNYFGIVDWYGQVETYFGGESFEEQASPGRRELALIEREEEKKVIESFSIREVELDKREQQITEKEESLAGWKVRLERKESELKAQEESFEKKTEKKALYVSKVQELANQFYGMPPDKSVERLIALEDDWLILDILEAMNARAQDQDQISIVPYLYSLMTPEDSARLNRKAALLE